MTRTHFRSHGGLGQLVALCALSALAVCCVYPGSSTRAVDESPSLLLAGAPADSVLVVDGIVAGSAKNYSKPDGRSLRVLPGRHVIELRRASDVVARREIFIDSQGLKVVDFGGVSP